MLTTYYSGREVFDKNLRWVLKLWAKYLRVLMMPLLSHRCFHHLGGAKMLIRELQSFIQPGDFVFKTDVYSFYASISHFYLLNMLYEVLIPKRAVHLITQYITRSIICASGGFPQQRGIPKGGTLSPILAALYLIDLDITCTTTCSGIQGRYFTPGFVMIL